jgi:hypothetical protein
MDAKDFDNEKTNRDEKYEGDEDEEYDEGEEDGATKGVEFHKEPQNSPTTATKMTPLKDQRSTAHHHNRATNKRHGKGKGSNRGAFSCMAINILALPLTIVSTLCSALFSVVSGASSWYMRAGVGLAPFILLQVCVDFAIVPDAVCCHLLPYERDTGLTLTRSLTLMRLTVTLTLHQHHQYY